MKRLIILITTLCALTASAQQKDSLRHVVIDSQDKVSGSTFEAPKYQATETITFTGYVGHIDGGIFGNLPKLKKVVFKCPVFTTGGTTLAWDCPELEEVIFERVVGLLAYSDWNNCPKFKGMTFKSAVIKVGSKEGNITAKGLDAIKKSKKMQRDVQTLIKQQTKVLQQKSDEFLVLVSRKIGFYDFIPALDTLGIEAAEYRAMVEKEAANLNPDARKNKLEILRESAPYAQGDKIGPFTYAEPSDSLLALSRERFNLDSIAGNGSDVEKIKNLLYWVHDLVRHDGSSAWPDCPFNLRDLYDVCQKENRGLNCRFMAFLLTEALLAEGIPARYVTCQSRAYDKDSDCHVICIAWAESLKKWIWVDPTFAAFVTDENGLLLHPGEVRQRLIDSRPLVLNPDANWNHDGTVTKEEYLETYMAKNLYLLSCRIRNEAQPEGKGSSQSSYIYLIPQGFKAPGNTTTDYDQFWTAPGR